MYVKRVLGGLTEVLSLQGRTGIVTTRDEPFEVPDKLGEALVKDGTGRFKVAEAPAQPAPLVAEAPLAPAPATAEAAGLAESA